MMARQTTHYSTWFLLSSILVSALPVQADDDLCLLCKGGVYDLKYPNTVVTSDGSTCTTVSLLELALEYTPGSTQCKQQIEAWRQICCSGSEIAEVEYTIMDNIPDINNIRMVGDYPKCNICRDGDYPSESSMVINMLYIGYGSCTQYWKVGQQGLIPTHLCDPLQYFAYESCGCGAFNTNWNVAVGGSSGGSSSSSNGNYQLPTASDSSSSSNNKNDMWWSNADLLHEDNDNKDDANEPWWIKANSPTSSAHAMLSTSRGYCGIAGVLTVALSLFYFNDVALSTTL